MFVFRGGPGWQSRAVALLPALLHGGYAGVLLAGGIFGTPVEASFGVRALVHIVPSEKKAESETKA